MPTRRFYIVCECRFVSSYVHLCVCSFFVRFYNVSECRFVSSFVRLFAYLFVCFLLSFVCVFVRLFVHFILFASVVRSFACVKPNSSFFSIAQFLSMYPLSMCSPSGQSFQFSTQKTSLLWQAKEGRGQ